MNALQAQMNPHFIFNSLTSLQNLIIKDKKVESREYLGSFARLTRLALSHSTKNSVPLKEEIELLDHYIQLEKIRFDNNFTYEIRVSLSNRDIIIAPMLIQPFVENAILHGLARKSSLGHLIIEFMDRDELSIKCVISDNGIGRFASKKERTGQSLGIQLIKDRLSILVGENAVKIVDLLDGDESLGTEVTVIIPIKSS